MRTPRIAICRKAGNVATQLHEVTFIPFDLETTGLHPVGCQIVEIGAVRFRADGTTLASFQQLVDPQCSIPDRATQVHGITNRMVRGQPALREVLPRFLEFVGDAPVVMMAHNARFDLGFLSVALSRYRQVGPPHPVIDSCGLARRRLSLPNYRLETLGRHLGLIDRERHRALDDAILLRDVFLHLIQASPAIRHAEELFRLTPALAIEVNGHSLSDPPSGYEGLWEAMADSLPIAMEYLGGARPGATRVVTPLGVMQNRGQIYLTALCHQSNCEKTFRLDRISAFRRLE